MTRLKGLDALVETADIQHHISEAATQRRQRRAHARLCRSDGLAHLDTGAGRTPPARLWDHISDQRAVTRGCM